MVAPPSYKCTANTKHAGPCKCNAKIDGLCMRHHKIRTGNNNNHGQDVRSRAGSTRNGFNVSYANHNSVEPPPELVKERNEKLDIKDGLCLYCGEEGNTNDHLVATCNTKYSIYGQNNSLNIVPCCRSCNGSKGGKVNSQFKKWLKDNHNWSQDKISVLFIWIEENKEYLLLDAVQYLNGEHQTINILHDIMDKSAKNKESTMENLIKHLRFRES